MFSNLLNRKTPEELREFIAGRRCPDAIAVAILQNKNTPIDVLLEYTHCEEIVNSLYLPIEVYDKIIREKNKAIISRLCRVEHTPSIVLEKIFKLYKHDEAIQFDLCRSKNSKISSDMLHELSMSTSWEVRAKVAKHNNVELRDLVTLQQDVEPRVLIALREVFIKNGFIPNLDKKEWGKISTIKIA